MMMTMMRRGMINMMKMMPVSAEPWFTRESTRLDVFPSSIDRFSTNSRVHWTCKHKRKGWTRFISVSTLAGLSFLRV